jgi:hypothetical protein
VNDSGESAPSTVVTNDWESGAELTGAEFSFVSLSQMLLSENAEERSVASVSFVDVWPCKGTLAY